MECCLSNAENRRSQWPRDQRQELFSPAQTLGSWVRIPLEAWTFAFNLFVLSCTGSGFAAGWSPTQESYLLSIWLRNCKTEAKVHHGLYCPQIILSPMHETWMFYNSCIHAKGARLWVLETSFSCCNDCTFWTVSKSGCTMFRRLILSVSSD
jgi:hypothetical protein